MADDFGNGVLVQNHFRVSDCQGLMLLLLFQVSPQVIQSRHLFTELDAGKSRERSQLCKILEEAKKEIYCQS